MGKLVMACESELQRNAEGLHGHDRYGADGRADRKVDQRVLLAMERRDLVDHDSREDSHDGTV